MMKKSELLARIEALESRLAVLEANPYRLYPTFPAPVVVPYTHPVTTDRVTCSLPT